MGEIPVLPGCRAWGETPELALEFLESVAEAFIRSHLKHGDPLPDEIALANELVVSI